MSISNTKAIGYTAATISTVLLGSVGIFVRNIEVDEYVITIARLGIGFLFLIIFLLPKRDIPKLKHKNFSFPLISTGILLALTMLFYMKAINSLIAIRWNVITYFYSIRINENIRIITISSTTSIIKKKPSPSLSGQIISIPVII